MRSLIIAVAFAAAIVGFAYLGHKRAHSDIRYLPVTTVSPQVCEGHPFHHGWVKTVAQYTDEPATLRVRCGDNAWINVDK